MASERPLILVTNDDGLLSPGLRAAAEAVADLGELLLVAPATQQTAMSRAFVRDADSGVIERVDLHIGDTTVAAYAVTGSPVMAVTHAVLELAPRPISLCISGINYGENVGSAIGVSGTVGAALEADVYGIPAIAAAITAQISEWRSFGEIDWTAAKHFTRLLVAQVLDEGMPVDVSVLNLNVPRGATAQTELRKTVQSHQPYYVRSKQASTRPLHLPYQFPLDIVVDWTDLEPGTDVHAVAQDAVASVTPLTWRMTATTEWTPRQTSNTGDGATARGAPWI